MGSFNGWGQTDNTTSRLPINQVGISKLKNRQIVNISCGLPYDDVIRLRNELEESIRNDDFKGALKFADILRTHQTFCWEYLTKQEYWSLLLLTFEFNKLLSSYYNKNYNDILQKLHSEPIDPILQEKLAQFKNEILAHIEIHELTVIDKATLESLLNELSNKEKEFAIIINEEYDFSPKQKSSTYELNKPPPSTGSLIGDIFLISVDAVKSSPNRTHKLSKPMFLFDFGLSLIYGDGIPSYAFEFTPRINVIEGKKNWSVSLGANAGVGILATGSTDTGNSGGVFSAEFSTTGRFNLGFGSKFDTKSKIGFFAGTGLGYCYLQSTTSYQHSYSREYNKALGLLYESGITLRIDEKSGNYYGLSIKASYLVNNNKDYGNVIDLTIIITWL